jgi:hypothetical protein
MVNIPKRDNGRFNVLLGNTNISVQKEGEATILKTLPALHAACVSGRGDIERVRAALKISARYGYTSFATRYLNSWISRRQKPIG